ncbi:MAG: 30S ribosome-binding factor RbfA [Candidatus Hydrogenedentes bacterium]|nr:30S ribosome-binding factor RbfA [Candidatus Hydrogenedentota bacterium]
MPHGRPTRVAEEIRKLVAELLTKGVKDPRIGFVSVMGVKMSPDLAYADVFVSLFGSDQEKKSSLVGLRQASGWMRREIGKQLRMRVTPELRFTEDTTLDDAYRLEEKFKEIHAEQSGHDHLDA